MVALRALAQTYFNAAYDMDADRFASVFESSSSVTKIGEDGAVIVTPIEAWLTAVRGMAAPRERGLKRDDRIVTIDVDGDLALVKVKFQMPPRYFTDLLSCLRVKGAWKIVQKVMRVTTDERAPASSGRA
ncbi:MAG: hypothetical protein HOW73_32600 [Polyangiaceae bacterium]|nr:hypothetical protein [Polyangiaceae bacterium]